MNKQTNKQANFAIVVAQHTQAGSQRQPSGSFIRLKALKQTYYPKAFLEMEMTFELAASKDKKATQSG